MNRVGDPSDQLERFALTQCARDLPRPHLFVCPKQDLRGNMKKNTAFTISISDFFAESLRIIERLAASGQYEDVLCE